LKTFFFFIRLEGNMNKFFTIAVAFLLLLTGMHVTIASHFCDGELAATKVSITGGKASCGMVQNEISNTSNETSFSSNCCRNETSVYNVDENYSTSEFHYKKIAQHILHIFYIPEGYPGNTSNLQNTLLTNVSPPDKNMANSVSMADICIFRI
jgi:hypothetical protein